MPHDEEDLLLRGPLHRAIRYLAVPMVLEMSMESLFVVADIFFVGRIGTDAVAVVGLSEALVIIIFAVGFGVATGATAMVSRRVGERRLAAANEAAAQAIYLGFGLAVLIGIVGALNARSLLEAMGATPELADYGEDYLRIAFAANFTIILLFVQNGIFRGAGDAKVAMYSLWIANGANLVLDPCLIFGLGPFPEMGLEGAAVATAIGRFTGVLYQWYRLFARSARVRLGLDAMRLRLGVLWRLLRVSGGAMLQELVETVSWVLLVRIIAAFGEQAVAGYTIAMRVLVFALLPAWGLGNAAATLVGQNLGARQPERAQRAVWLTGFSSMAFLFVVSLLSVALAEPLIGLFTENEEVLAFGTDCLQVVAYGYVFYAWGMVMVQSFNGAGDTLTPTLMNVTTLWFFKLPAAYFLAHQAGLGAQGVFWAITLSYSLLAVLGVVLFRRGKWKRKVV